MRLSTSDKIFHVFNYLLLTLVLLVVAYPLIFIISSSFSSGSAIIAGKVWFLPVEPTLDGYRTVFGSSAIWIGYRNSIFYTVTGTLLSLIITFLTAYPLSCRHFYGKKYVNIYFIITMFFSGGMIPTYLLIRNLGLLNNWLVMILPGALSIWNVIITRTVFQSNDSLSLQDAASIDGADDFTYFFRILLPLSGALIAVNCLFFAVGQWNSYFSALIYLNDEKLYPLQLILRSILVQNDVTSIQSASQAEEILEAQRRAELMKYSLIIISSLPLLIAYPFVQKHFVRGVMIGSIKG